MKKMTKILTLLLVITLMLGCSMPAYAAAKTKKTKKTYTVTFKDSITGKTIKKVRVKAGQNAKAPKIPKHKGWKFLKWNKSLKNIRKDKTVKTVYYKNVFKSVSGNANNDEYLEMMRKKDKDAYYRLRVEADKQKNNENMQRVACENNRR